MALTFGSGIPKSGLLEIGIALVLQDRFSNQAAQASSQIRRLQSDARLAVQSNISAAYQLGSMGLTAFKTMASGVVDMVKYGAEFVDTMTTVEAITASTTEQMGDLKDIAMSLGKTTMFSSQDVASGMKYLAMAGNTAEEIQGMIKGATYAAGATGLALGGKGGAADVITNVMRTFQLEGEKNALWVGDVMTNATLSANISMQDLAASIRYAAADMTNLGYELPEVAAAIGTLGNMGIQGSMAGTALANMMRYLNKSISDTSYKGHKLLEKLGLTKEDLTTPEGKLKDLYSIISIIKNALVNMDPTEMNMFTTGIFGVRGNRAAVALMRDIEGYRKLYEDVGNTDIGYAQSVVEKRMSTVAGQLNAMKSTWENLKASFTEALSGVLIPIFKSVTKWLDGIRVILGTGIGKAIASISLLGTALFGIGSAIMVIRSRIMLLQTDSQVTGRNMFAILVGGWKSAYFSALEYSNILKAINMQHNIGVMGNPNIAMIAAGGVPGYTATYGKKGVRFRDSRGRFVSPKNPAIATALGASAGAATTAVVGRGISSATAWGGKLLSLGGKLFKLMGGWWGVALMTISWILPKVIGSIKSNNNTISSNQASLDSNTVAVNYLNNSLNEDRSDRRAGRNALSIPELKMAVNLLYQLLLGQKDKKVTINLNTNKGSNSFVLDSEDDEDMFNLSLK